METGRKVANSIYYDGGFAVSVVTDKLYKKECFIGYEFPSGYIHEDLYVLSKLLYLEERIAITDSALYFYRYNPESITGKTFGKDRIFYLNILEKNLKFYKEHNDTEVYSSCLNHYMYSLPNYYFEVRRQIKNSKTEQENIHQKMIWAKSECQELGIPFYGKYERFIKKPTLYYYKILLRRAIKKIKGRFLRKR